MVHSTALRPAADGGAASSGTPRGVSARRLMPPSWRDPRLLVGLIMVLGSVVVGALTIRAVDDTIPFYVARHTLSPGQALRTGDVEVVRGRMGAAADRYLSATAQLPQDRVVLRTIGAGELVALASLASRDEVAVRAVSVPVDPQEATDLGAGTLVDIWVAASSPDRSDAFQRPVQLASNAQVASRVIRRAGLSGAEASSVRLLLTPDLVPDLIEAVDNDARITLLPVPAPMARSES